MSDVMPLDDARAAVAPLDAIEVPVAVERHEFRSRPQRNRRMLLYSTNEVGRHRICQPVLADQEVDALGRLREKHRSLTRGVPPAHDHDLVSPAQLRLHARGGVVHARPFELRQVCEGRLTVLGP
jgi:hypothetical protein